MAPRQAENKHRHTRSRHGRKFNVDRRIRRQRATGNNLWQQAQLWAKAHDRAPLYTFFGRENPYPCSNHAPVPTFYKGRTYPTSEHAYLSEQALALGFPQEAARWASGQGVMRFGHRVYNMQNPKDIKAMSTQLFKPLKRRGDPRKRSWDAQKAQIMYKIVLAKFKHNPTAKEALLNTGRAYLLENSPYDDFWGVGRKLTPNEMKKGPNAAWGSNTLGKILMAVRTRLRSDALLEKALTKRRNVRRVALYKKHHPRDKVPAVTHLSFPQLDIHHIRLQEAMARKRNQIQQMASLELEGWSNFSVLDSSVSHVVSLQDALVPKPGISV